MLPIRSVSVPIWPIEALDLSTSWGPIFFPGDTSLTPFSDSADQIPSTINTPQPGGTVTPLPIGVLSHHEI